jgi:hypothetical protein
MGGMKLGKNNFLWKTSPFALAHRAGFQTPMSRMVEYGEPLGRAIEMSGDPAQRAVRKEVQKAWGNFMGRGGGYNPQPYNAAPLQNMMQQQNAVTQQMMGNLLQQEQAGNLASQTQQAQNLIAANNAQTAAIQSGLQGANQNLAGFASTPAVTPDFALQPATQTTQNINQFKLPATTGLTFGGA